MTDKELASGDQLMTEEDVGCCFRIWCLTVGGRTRAEKDIPWDLSHMAGGTWHCVFHPLDILPKGFDA